MGVKKITEKPISEEMKESSYVLVSQDEEINGEIVQALRKIPISVLSRYLGVDDLKKVASLIPLKDSNNSISIGFEDRIAASIINASGEFEAVDSEYAYCAHYTGLGAYIGKELRVSGAYRKTAPLYVFKDIDGNVIDMGWPSGAEDFTIVAKYAVIVPKGATDIFVNQLCENSFSPCVDEPIKRFEVGEEDLSEEIKKSTRKSFSNALKGTASGQIITLCDVSSVEHEIECVVSGVEDVSMVTVSRCGKNLIPYPYVHSKIVQNGITFTANGDGSITVNGTATAYTSFTLSNVNKPVRVPVNTSVVFSSGYTNTNSTVNIVAKKIINGAVSNAAYIYPKKTGYTFVTDVNEYNVYAYVQEGVTVDNVTIYPQIEIGTTATGYEQYKQMEEYTPNTNGTVEGMTSLAPNMTLMTDTDGVVIDVTYNRDINKAFEELTQAIISLGGNI